MPNTTTYPYRTVVRILARLGTTTYQGSGVLVSPDEVLTAAHLVWSGTAGLATNVVVTPGYDAGAAPFGSISATVTHYNTINDGSGFITQANTNGDYALLHLATPVNLGVMTIGADFGAGAVTISGYPASAGGSQVDRPSTVSVNAAGNLAGGAIGAGSSGGPVWITDGAGDATVVGVVSSLGSDGTGFDTRITADVRAQLLTWIADDDGLPRLATFLDNRTGEHGTLPLSVASDGPNYLQWQYIWSSSDGVALATSMPNSFLHGGTGDDALQVTSGRNVLDGGTGSNYLVGGTGMDTFFTDARGPGVVWSTLANFHAGDVATLWGFTAGVSSYVWEADPSGAPGATGATLRANIVGGGGRDGSGVDASITFAGLSVAQAKGLTITAGVEEAGSYLSFRNPGV